MQNMQSDDFGLRLLMERTHIWYVLRGNLRQASRTERHGQVEEKFVINSEGGLLNPNHDEQQPY
jgi:hypothetical protein